MKRIADAFSKAKETGQGALLPFVCAGSPERDSLTKLLPALESSGASIVEIGFPYSDPIADGPTIAAAPAASSCVAPTMSSASSV